MKKQKKTLKKKEKQAEAFAPFIHDLRKIQMGFLQSFRQVFFYDPSLADDTKTFDFIKTFFILLKDNGTGTQHLQLWRSGNNLKVDVITKLPGGVPLIDKIHSGDSPVLIGYKIKTGSTDVDKGFLIVGTGDFRNLTGDTSKPKPVMQYIVLPDESVTTNRIVIACSATFELSIYA